MDLDANKTFDFSSFHNTFKHPQRPPRSKSRFQSSQAGRLTKTESLNSLPKPPSALSALQAHPVHPVHPAQSYLPELDPLNPLNPVNPLNPLNPRKPPDSSESKLNPRKFSHEFYTHVLKVIPKDNNEFVEIVNGCLRLEEVVALYEQRNGKLKLRIEELEKENLFLGKRLQEAWKSTKVLKKPEIVEKDSQKHENSFLPKSQTGKYLKGLSDKHGPGTQEFFREIEAFLDYREHKLKMSIEHYKNIIENLQVKLKKKNSEYLNGMTVGSLGKFFKECVEDVKKYIVDRRHSNKVLVSDKLRIMEKFLLNENVLKMIYNQLIDDKGNDGPQGAGNENEILALESAIGFE